jgi:hypothetical protein
MKKEDFPTFLNEQPTVIFGRTVRELLWIVCAIVCAYQGWNIPNSALHGALGMTLGIILGSVVGIAFLVVALVPLGGRSLEEWIAVWLIYAVMPKLYLYKAAEEEVEFEEKQRDRAETARQQAGKRIVDLDILEE